MRHAIPFALTLLPAVAPAQTPPCFALNDANTSVGTTVSAYGFAGQNTVGWQITPSTAVVVFAAQVFTRNGNLSGDRFMMLELWSDAGGVPGSRLAGGAWRIVNARPNAWQGCDLDQPIVLPANAPAWLVWIEPGFSVLPYEPGGVTAPRATRSAGGTWTGGTTAAPKLRLFCSLLDDAHSQPFGAACAQSTGLFASVFTNEQPSLGNAGFLFETSGNPPGGAVFLVLGFDPTFVSAPVVGFPTGCLQHTDLVASLFLLAGTGNTRGPTCAGYASLALPLPLDPGLTGQVVSAQAVPYDAGAVAPLPFATSNAQRVTLF